MTSLDSTGEAFLRDPHYLLRLYHKIVRCLVKCNSSSFARTLSPSFMNIDSRYRTRNSVQVTELWHLKGTLRQIFPASILSDRELLMLLTVLPLDDYGVVDDNGELCVSPVTMLLCLRQMCSQRASLLQEILCTMDANLQRPNPTESISGLALTKHIQGCKKGFTCILECNELLDLLTQSYMLTLSEAYFLIDYCSAGSTPTATSVAVDGAYLYALLYQRPLPVDIHFSLLMSVFTESTVDPNMNGHSGTIALIEELRRVPLESGNNIILEKENELCIDIGVELANCSITAKSFEDLCKGMRVGLVIEEVRKLFHYLKDDGPHEVILVQTLLREFVRHFAPAGESLFTIVVEAVRRYLSKAGGMLALPRLHLSLNDGFLPIAKFIGALREAGVSNLVSDVELEWLRFKGRNRTQLVRLLSGRFSTNREALVRQLFNQIVGSGGSRKKNECVEIEHVLSFFHPENAEDALVGSGEEWRHVMSRYFYEKSSDTLTYDQFVYFWNAVSAACSDDSVFTMIIWRCFKMHVKRL